MKELHTLIARMRAAGIQFQLKEGKLVTRAPHGAITEALSQSIRENRDAIVDFLRRREEAAAVRTSPMTRQLSMTPPLSYAQKRLWLIDRMGNAGASYNLPAAIQINGPLDADAMEHAFASIIERHEILRTIYLEQAGDAVCRVVPGRTFHLERIDATDLDGATPDEIVHRIIADDCRRSFDLEKDLMLRATLICTGLDSHVLMLNIHHIASDGWSTGVLISELVRAYRARIWNLPSELEDLSVQYGDYARWQKDWLDKGLFDRQLEYWKIRLAGIPQLHGLPTDRPRPSVQSHAGAVQTCRLDTRDTTALHRLCREEGVSIFMALQLAFAILLARWSHENDIVFGTPIAGRMRPELEPLIGFFVNTLVIRNRIDPFRSFRESLCDSAAAINMDYDHQSVPFDVLVDVLNPERSAAYSPLVQIVFSMQNNASTSAKMEGLSFSPVEMPMHTAKFDLMLNVAETDEGVVASWEYSTVLFNDATIQRMADQYLRLVADIVGRPDASISALRMLDPQEAIRLIETMNATRREYPATSLPHVFREVVRRHAGRIALVDGEHRLSYAELDARVRSLAAFLREQGIDDEARIGIFMDRGIDMIVAMLAVLHAGGAYVPLDLSMPPERIATVIEDADCVLVLCTRRTRANLDTGTCGIVVVDTPGARKSHANDDEIALPQHCGGRRLAYVMYTSGSTGMPKGVMVEQRGILRLVLNTDYIVLTPQDNVAQASNCAFDASTFEIWGALLNGACLSFVDTDTLLDPSRLESALSDLGITAIWMTTSLLGQVVGVKPGIFSGMKHVLFGGEPADRSTVDRILEAGKPSHLINGYGPTENTTFTATHEIKGISAIGYPIGRPIANTTCYVVGRGDELLPYGAIGELLTGGDGLSRGYLNRSELTAEKFIPNPFLVSGDPLYRTGDIVRWLPDGTLQYLGRVDDLVKIRGFRIELGEIEHALLALAEVAEAVVLVHEVAGTGKMLAAYVVPAQDAVGESCTTNHLKFALSKRLPPYMVPTTITFLDRIPINANGKTDRSKLPPPDAVAIENDVYEVPNGPFETALAMIWSDVLGVEKPSANANFFELGGNSLLLMRLCGRVRVRLGIDAPFAEFFTNASIRRQAQWLRDQAGPDARAATPIDRVAEAEDHPLSFAQQRLWFEYLLGNSASYSISVATRLIGRLDAGALSTALTRVVIAHDILRSRYRASAQGGRLRIDPASNWAMEMVDLIDQFDAEAVCEHMLAAEVGTPFNLQNGPVFKAILYRLAPEMHILLLNMHHIVADGWSMQVLFDQVTGVYRGIVGGDADAAVEPLPVQYTDYTRWLLASAEAPDSQAGLDYWAETLAFVREQPLLPTDGSRYTAPQYPLREHRFSVPSDIVQALNVSAVSDDASLFMALIAAYGLVICDYGNYGRTVIGTDVAGRDQTVTERLIGLFVGQMAIITETEAAPTFRELLRTVRARTLEAYRHQHVSIEKIVSRLNLERGMTQHPLFQTKLVLQNFRTQTDNALAGIERRQVALTAKHCKLDLMLTLIESAEGLQGEWEYNADYFNEQTIRSIEANFMTVLQAAAKDPGVALSTLREQFQDRRRQGTRDLRSRLASAPRIRKPMLSTNQQQENQ